MPCSIPLSTLMTAHASLGCCETQPPCGPDVCVNIAGGRPRGGMRSCICALLAAPAPGAGLSPACGAVAPSQGMWWFFEYCIIDHTTVLFPFTAVM